MREALKFPPKEESNHGSGELINLDKKAENDLFASYVDDYGKLEEYDAKRFVNYLKESLITETNSIALVAGERFLKEIGELK